jgi:hypothetical protein
VSRPKEQATRPRVLLWVIFDRVIELSLRVDVRFDPESDQDRAATQYVAKGHVWTAPGWQEESSLCSDGRSGHVFGLFARYP